MTATVTRIARTRGALAAAATAGLVGLTILAQNIVQVLIALVAMIGTPGIQQLTPLSPVTPLVTGLFTTILPFCAGYFVSLWAIAPISEKLRVPHVITRSVLATGIGATLWFIVGALNAVITVLSAAGWTQLALVPDQLGFALQSAISALATLLPLGVLGGVLLWNWRRDHPASYHIEGLVDV